MPIRMNLPDTFAARLAAADRPQIGLWVCSASPLMAEVVAGSGVDWVLIDAEHSPNDLQTILHQLYAVSGYPVAPVVRPPIGDTVVVKQYLDLGVQNLLVPMVDSAEHARALVRAVRYPGEAAGVRGVGASLARSSRWNRVEGYLADASSTVSLTVQIESATAVANVEEILAVDGVDAIFVGPADLAGSMGLLGQPSHPDVVEAALTAIRAARAAGKPAGINAFVPDEAERYLAAGASFAAVGADVALLARATESLADRFVGSRPSAPDATGEPDASSSTRTSY
ncbi:HpcH/HpaI aldolase/citrate lyase family protein [Agromyces intestinalis]|uniref:HpcH/HpaI aldolase/citrate lyase family protein n=1 Tax=Agromyces intestinalis TaxID=2592652 RepID=A0A5C1YF74_9MICO|nr:HpcH/HpaI aldolase/citrate lyase family protein [Agromyces intestinalis]QEO13639.1 HpcH/HpaI aldolase/citrate lyase family protein [Agromyces intestinalis]